MSDLKHKTTVYMDISLHEDILEMSNNMRISQGRFIREAVREKIDHIKLSIEEGEENGL